MGISVYPPPSGGGVVDYTFFFSGTLQANQQQLIPVQAKRQSADVNLLECFLQQAANSAVLVSFFKNGVSIGQVTIAGGATTGSLAIATVHFNPEDLCTATIDQVGTIQYGVTLTAYARVAT